MVNYDDFIKNLVSKASMATQKAFDKEANSGIDLLNKWNRNYGYTVIESPDKHSHWDVILKKDNIKLIVEIKKLRLTLEESLKRYGKEGQLIEELKLKGIQKASIDYEAEPYYFLFFACGNVLIISLKDTTSFIPTIKNCKATSVGYSQKIEKKIYLIPFVLFNKIDVKFMSSLKLL